MKEYDFHQLLENNVLVEQKIRDFLGKEILKKQNVDKQEIEGHILKADHNLRFVAENIKLGFVDWAITGCYYASYHAAIALILTREYSSKNHLATLCILIKEFYRRELSKEDIEMLGEFVDYKDLLFYVESKNKREDASYSSNLKFDKKDAEGLRVKAVLFVSKIKEILKKEMH